MTPGNHPNTTAVFITAAVVAFALNAAAKHGLVVSKQTGYEILGVATSARLFIGRRGIIGAIRELWLVGRYGSDGPPKA